MVVALDFIYEDLYFEASDFANELALEASKYYSKDINTIKCFDIESYVAETNDIEIIQYDFKEQLRNKMLGSTSKIFDEVLIIINKNLFPERKNFTTMHEIIHFYKDIPFAEEGHTFSDMISENGYFPEDLPKEYRANIGASILMANDHALEYALHKFSTFEEVANYFFMSKSALHNRIKEYLIFKKQLTPNFAQQFLNNYRYGNKKNFLQFLNKICT